MLLAFSSLDLEFRGQRLSEVKVRKWKDIFNEVINSTF